MNGFYILLGLYAVAGTGISVAVMRKNRSQSDYFVGGGTIGWVVSAMTYAATTYSAFMMVGLVGLSYATGVGALIFELVYLVATVILLSVFGGRIWDLAREHNLVSPMELFSLRYGRPAATVGSVVAALALVPYTAVQVIGLAVILEGYGLSFTGGVLFAVVVIGLWALLGGLRGGRDHRRPAGGVHACRGDRRACVGSDARSPVWRPPRFRIRCGRRRSSST